MQRLLSPKKRAGESGVTVIELSIAGFVLVFGMLSLLGLLMAAVGNNGRSKIDSSATMLSQAVLEQISAKLAGGGPGTLTDNANCDGTGVTHLISYQPAMGAPLNAQGYIDFGAAQVANYSMDYVDCNNNVRMTYDVRWDVQDLSGKTYLVVVGAKPKSTMPTKFGFALPVNMRTYVGGN